MTSRAKAQTWGVVTLAAASLLTLTIGVLSAAGAAFERPAVAAQ